MAGIFFRILPILMLGVVLSSCNSSKKAVKPLPPPPSAPSIPPPPVPTPIQPQVAKDEPVLRFEKKCPIGKCPDFVVEVFADGRATYFGRKNVSKTGNWQAILPKIWMQETVSVSEAMGYPSFLPQYPQNDQSIPDLPSTLTKLKLSDQRIHSVNDYFDAPPMVQSYENWLFDRIESIKWQKAQGAD